MPRENKIMAYVTHIEVRAANSTYTVTILDKGGAYDVRATTRFVSGNYYQDRPVHAATETDARDIMSSLAASFRAANK